MKINSRFVLAAVIAVGLFSVAVAGIKSDILVTDLIAAKHYDAGNIKVCDNGDTLFVLFATRQFTYLGETHLHVATDPGSIPQKNGNPIPGQFDFKEDHSWLTRWHVYKIPMDPNWVSGTELYIAGHAVVYKTCGVEETAWGAGVDFPGANWATYFVYTVP
jgi:hypothetical protein